MAANALELARNGVPKAPFYVTGRIGERAFSVHAEGERMILKREGQERTEVDLGAPGAAELPLIDSAAASGCRREMPLPVCPDGSPQGDVVEDEVGRADRPWMRACDGWTRASKPAGRRPHGAKEGHHERSHKQSAAPASSPLNARVVRSGRSERSRRNRPQPVSREAQRVAAAILEVLAGVRTPTEAAAAVGLSVPRYYLWEQRALEGLVRACEPRPRAREPASGTRLRCWRRKSPACGRTVPAAGAWCGHRSGRSAWPPTGRQSRRQAQRQGSAKPSGLLAARRSGSGGLSVRALKAVAALRGRRRPRVVLTLDSRSADSSSANAA